MTEIELSKNISKKEEKPKPKPEPKPKPNEKSEEIKNEKEMASNDEQKKRKRSDDAAGIDSQENTDSVQREEKYQTAGTCIPVTINPEVNRNKDDVSEMLEKKSLDKEERKLKKAQKKAEKEELLNKVPKTDEHGIAYTKVQLKRMMKRVKRGLNPVATEEEERERRRQIRTEKVEEEEELAGLIFKKDTSEQESENEDEERVDDEIEDDGDTNSFEESEEEDKAENKKSHLSDNIIRPKKKARSKPIPSDYTCMACNNKHQPLHWIYDCPDKIYKPGANKVKKKLRGIHEPASQKVFVSGLPFSLKPKEVEMYFEKEMKCGKVLHCRLLQFEDTKRSKGTGFVTFDTDEGAINALKLNGTILSLPEKDDKKKSSSNKNNQKELRLSVKKLLNRTATKKGRRY